MKIEFLENFVQQAQKILGVFEACMVLIPKRSLSGGKIPPNLILDVLIEGFRHLNTLSCAEISLPPQSSVPTQPNRRGTGPGLHAIF